jgi:hypothetical protein
MGRYCETSLAIQHEVCRTLRVVPKGDVFLGKALREGQVVLPCCPVSLSGPLYLSPSLFPLCPFRFRQSLTSSGSGEK